MTPASYEWRRVYGILRTISTGCILISFIPLFFPHAAHIFRKGEVEVAERAWYLISVGIAATMIVSFNIRAMIECFGAARVQRVVLPLQGVVSVVLVLYILKQTLFNQTLCVAAFIVTVGILIILTLRLLASGLDNVALRYNVVEEGNVRPETKAASLQAFYFLECLTRSLSFTYLVFLLKMPDVHNLTNWHNGSGEASFGVQFWGGLYVLGITMIRLLCLVPPFTRYIETNSPKGLVALNMALGGIVVKDLTFYALCVIFGNHIVVSSTLPAAAS